MKKNARISLGLAMTALATGLTVGLAPSASAGPINNSCGPGANPYDYTGGSQRQPMAGIGYPGRNDQAGLYTSTNHPYYGQNLIWVWGSKLKAGDTVSLDWTDDGGRTYHACHATVGGGKSTVTTKAVNAEYGRQFRVCLKPKGQSWKCMPGWMFP